MHILLVQILVCLISLVFHSDFLLALFCGWLLLPLPQSTQSQGFAVKIDDRVFLVVLAVVVVVVALQSPTQGAGAVLVAFAGAVFAFGIKAIPF